jgi:hypothetical protein
MNLASAGDCGSDDVGEVVARDATVARRHECPAGEPGVCSLTFSTGEGAGVFADHVGLRGGDEVGRAVSGAAAVIDQAPLATVGVPRTVPPSSSVTVAPSSQVPLMVGCAMLVMPSSWCRCRFPEARPASAAGSAASSVTFSRGREGLEMLPAASLCVAVMALVPAVSAPSGSAGHTSDEGTHLSR